MEDPKISIVITCYNYAEYVEDAIISVINQTYKNIELIIIDDGSTDNTLDIISKYKNGATVISRENRGIINTRNEGLNIAQGNYLCFLDADDTLPSNYIEEGIKTAIKTRADIVYTNYEYFGAEKGKSDFPEFNLEKLKNSNYIHISSLVKKSAVKDIMFDDNLNGMTHEDWDFFLNLTINGRTAALCKNTYLNYRKHGHSRNNMMQSDKDRKKYIDSYCYILYKHKKLHRDEIDYLSGLAFANWYIDIYEQNEQLKNKLKHNKVQICNLENDISNIVNSKSYRFGLAVSRPIKYLKRRSSNSKAIN